MSKSKRRPPPPPAALQPAPSPLSRYADRLACTALLILTLFWWQAASFPFLLLDDPTYVSRNPIVLSGFTPTGIYWAFTNVDANLYQPFTWLSYMLDATLFGPAPRGFHITNILFHTANTLLVFLFFRMTAGSPGRAFLVAAIFSLHPQRVESVAWVTERKDVLFFFFGILALCAYAHYARTRKTPWYLATIALAALSLLAKATLLTLPLLLLLLDIWPLKRRPTIPWRRLLIEKIPFAALSLAIVAATQYALKSQQASLSFQQHPVLDRLTNACQIYLLYLRDAFYFENLSIIYLLRPVPLLHALACLALLAAITAAAAFFARKSPAHGTPALIGWLFFLTALLPVSGILVQSGMQARADRFTYLPAIGLAAALIYPWPAHWFNDQLPRTIRTILAAAALFYLGWHATLRLTLWKDPLELYLDGIARDPSNWYLYTRAGEDLAQTNSFESAEKYYRDSLRINPNFHETHNSLGSLLARTGRLNEAVEHFRIARDLAPHNTQIRANFERATSQPNKPP